MSSSAENNNNNHDFENEEDVNYTPAKQESIDDILKKDAEDERCVCVVCLERWWNCYNNIIFFRIIFFYKCTFFVS